MSAAMTADIERESVGAGTVVALVGNPNSGKTTIFNALTGLRQKVGNYPGITVERRSGSVTLSTGVAEVIDLPGTYSLVTVSPDEQVVSDVLRSADRPDAVIAVVDASNLARNLYVVSQLIDLRLPIIVALNMIDVAAEEGRPVDAAALRGALGCPVVPVVGRTGDGIAELIAQISHAAVPPPVITTPHLDAPEEEIEARYRWVDAVVAKTVEPGAPRGRTFTERVDAVLMHRVLGLVIFAVIMTLLFAAVFWVAKPLMDGVKTAVAWSATKTAASMPEGPLKALVIDGAFAGVGAVLVFVPQIALLFLSLALLEDSGYLARAAFLMDRLLSRVGLHGKSFIPLLSSFACAIPGILATRTIDGRRDRLATILVAPFMTCSARLPVYALLIGACIPGASPLFQAIFLLGLYVAGIVAAVLTALLLKRRLASGASSTFILELPTYTRPQPSQLALQVWTNTRAFVTRAGTTIFAFSIVLWALLYYPRPPLHVAYETPRAAQAAQLENSFAGRAGRAIEPVVEPLGFDWKIGLGLVSAFAAREVFVSTLGIAYSADSGGDTKDLSRAMANDRRRDGSRVWTPLVAASLSLWFVLAMQCMSTMAVVRRETGGWRWPIAQLVFMNGVAYLACLLLYQVGRLFGG